MKKLQFVFIILILSSCQHNDMTIANYPSPDGSLTAHIVLRQSGATVADSLQIYITYKYLPIPINVGWISHSSDVKFCWKSKKTFLIYNAVKQYNYIEGYPLPGIVNILVSENSPPEQLIQSCRTVFDHNK